MATDKKSHLGFTLVELLITLGLLTAIAGFGLVMSMDGYKQYALRSETDIIASMLQKARSQSMNNINEKRHGVHVFLDPDSHQLTYVLFACVGCISYPGPSTSDLPIAAWYHASIKNPALPFDVVFDQLTGCLSTTASACLADSITITVKQDSTNENIIINREGAISW